MPDNDPVIITTPDVEPVLDAQPIVPDDEEKVDYKSLYTELNDKWSVVEPYVPYIPQFNEFISAKRQQEADDFADLLSSLEPPQEVVQGDNKSDVKPPAINPTALNQAKQFMSLGAAYQKAYPTIMEQTMTLEAIRNAVDVLGRDSTIAEIEDMAKDFLSLGDPRLMPRYAAQLKKMNQNKISSERSTSGVDRLPKAPAKTYSPNTVDFFEQKLFKYNNGDGDDLTPAEWNQYAKLRGLI